MTHQFHHGPTFCADCGGAITATSMRCRRCAAAVSRANRRPPARPKLLTGKPHDVAWIGGNDRRYNNVRLLKALTVPLDPTNEILEAANAT